jgi:hypothetical protein
MDSRAVRVQLYSCMSYRYKLEVRAGCWGWCRQRSASPTPLLLPADATAQWKAHRAEQGDVSRTPPLRFIRAELPGLPDPRPRQG